MNPVVFPSSAVRLGACLLAPFLCASLVFAQAAAHTSTDVSLNPEEIKGHIESLLAGGDSALSPDKQLTLENLKAALARTESAKASQRKAEEYAEALKTAPALIAKLGAELEKPARNNVDSSSADLSPTQAQLQMATLQIKAVSLRTESRRIEESLRVMGARQLAARDELTDLREKQDRRADTVPADASPMLIESYRIKAEAVVQDLSARIANTEQEILSLPTREAIANARHGLVERELRQVERDISDLGRRMDAREQEDTAAKLEAADQAVLKLANAPESFLRVAEETATMRREMSTISSNLRKLWSSKDRIHSQLQNIAISRKNADQILAFGRIGEEPGRLLREVAKKLPASAALEHRIKERQRSIVDTRVRQFEIEQQLGKASASPAAVDRFLESSHLDLTGPNRAQAQSLLSARRSALSDLFDIERRQQESLMEINALQTQLLQRSSQLRSVLDQRLLWLPSGSPIGMSWGKSLVAVASGLLTRENLEKLELAARNTIASIPLGKFLLLIAAVVLVVLRKRLLVQLEALAMPIGTRSDRFTLTLNALLVTVLLALPLPAALGFFGSVFLEPYNPTSFPNALGRGLVNVAIVLFILGLFRNMCRHHGL
ncbi:hypothetical protein, partial [Dokdonella sp.]|uniref:hypothetical protein n=1 Tax=Dokdonella sp. TaxID=2291710 RepID=UPI003C40B287